MLLDLTYSYEWTPDEGSPNCPVCDGSLTTMAFLNVSDWVKCEECGVECNCTTGEVFAVTEAS